MRPVYQTVIHGESTKGNCLRASLASIFELDIDDIPKFELMDKSAWKKAFVLWLDSMGVELHEQESSPQDNQFHLMIGESPRGVLHCVVAKNGVMIHDPHPSQAGLLNVKKHWVLVKNI
jgi:hypothetical protein